MTINYKTHFSHVSSQFFTAPPPGPPSAPAGWQATSADSLLHLIGPPNVEGPTTFH